jgi:hypothetical protein
LQHEQTTLGFRLGVSDIRRQMLPFQCSGNREMPAFGRGQIAEELPDRGVAYPLDGALVEASCLQLHQLGLSSHHVEAERPDQPYRTPPHEASDILSPQQRNVLAKPRPVCLDERGAVLRLLLLHLAEYGGRRRIGLPQPVREVAVDATVLLFERDRECDHFGLRQIIKVSGHHLSEVVGLLVIVVDNISKTGADVQPR